MDGNAIHTLTIELLFIRELIHYGCPDEDPLVRHN
jgi:hypothetical protein